MMRLIQIFALALVLFSGSLAAEESKQTDQRVYDRYGNYQGQIRKESDKSDASRVYDRYGNYQGRTDEKGRIYDRYGNYQGQVKKGN